MSHRVLRVQLASHCHWKVLESIRRSSGLWQHALGCTVDQSLLKEAPCLFTGPEATGFQIVPVSYNCDKSMTRRNLGKDKICLTCTSRPQSTTERIQGKNHDAEIKMERWDLLTCSLALVWESCYPQWAGPSDMNSLFPTNIST